MEEKKQKYFSHEELVSFPLASLPRKELLTDWSGRSGSCLLFHAPAWPEPACSSRHTPANWGFHPWSCVLGP